MGKKKAQTHVQESMSRMVSKAALAQMGAPIENFVNQKIQQLGSQLARQQASTLEMLYSRVVVLEDILMEKYGITKDDLSNKVSDVEDKKDGVVQTTDAIQKGDLTRVEVSTKTKDQETYQGSTRIKMYETGTGQTLGNELEDEIVGMKTGEEKEIQFGKDKSMLAKVSINRVSRPIPKPAPEGKNEDAQTPG